MNTRILMMLTTAALFSVSSIAMANETAPTASSDAKSKTVKASTIKHKKPQRKHAKYKRVRNSKNMQVEAPHEMR